MVNLLPRSSVSEVGGPSSSDGSVFGSLGVEDGAIVCSSADDGGENVGISDGFISVSSSFFYRIVRCGLVIVFRCCS